jgi:predicted O-methyltransferase YrrM
MSLKGGSGGPWTAETHNSLYPGNLNGGLVQFIVRHIRPKNFLELGGGVGALANAVANACELTESYVIEPEVSVPMAADRNLRLLNINILSAPAPLVLDRKFDLVLSIEVAEHIDRAKHEMLFDFLAARAGRWVVFSGARPGQGGHGHISERPEVEWRAEFVSRGFAFDARMTALVRTLCDAKNINHRINLQVFRAPEDELGLDQLEARAQPHLAELLERLQAGTGTWEGSPFYIDGQDAVAGRPAYALRWKRENLMRMAAQASSILVVGMEAGHAALLCLLANPRARVVCVENRERSFTRPCFDYLAQSFGERVRLIVGEAGDAWPQLRLAEFDLAHLGAGRSATIAADLDALRPRLEDDHLVVVDDTQDQALDGVLVDQQARGEIETSPFAAANGRSLRSRRRHRLLRFVPPAERVDSVLARMASVYKDTNHASIYLTRGADGQCLGRPRAAGLLSAIRDVETSGLGGAFVEVGVAAGHSSVFAALAASRFIPRDFYLFDTFRGFVGLPDEKDVQGRSIREYDLSKYVAPECESRAVRWRMREAGIPEERLFIIEGQAEDRVADFAPPKIAILRLDVSLYAPTLVSLETMYERLEKGGWLVVNDYGHWQGCRDAVDGFFAKRGEPFRGVAVDRTCYIQQK